MEAIIAIIGLLYFGARIIFGNLAKQSNNMSTSYRDIAYNTRYKPWEKQVEDSDFEWDTVDFVQDPVNREAVWEIVREAYKQMPLHKQYESSYDWWSDGIMDKSKAGKQAHRKRVLDEPVEIILAQHGKVQAIQTHGELASHAIAHGQRQKQEWDQLIEYWVYIRNELRKHGVDARLICKYEESKEVFDWKYGMRTVYEYKYCDVNDIDRVGARYKTCHLSWFQGTYGINDQLKKI